MKKTAEIYRFWNATQKLTLIIEDKTVTLAPPEEINPDDIKIPTGVKLTKY